MDFKEVVLAMAAVRPNAKVSVIVDLALAVTSELPDMDNAEAFGAWAMRQRVVAEFARQDKKIHAIKELRQLTKCSLAQAKYAMDAVMN